MPRILHRIVRSLSCARQSPSWVMSRRPSPCPLLPFPPTIRISSSILEAIGQKRFASRGTEYQPSQRKRKRKHGFLARKRSGTGKRILVRRREKGRTFLTH
ncbi:hypothetical protein BJ138DRAFT_525839 [Hygrophoropsis aurantiaca]|uniref:Uncharacterized protein n=1 Tax=Hygrophoropsis aurantiaca TaxID=72124 RepID=A0ACB8AMV1_9AGAM|nr:hypothetical protein BJ138DRAFT_525839 [Hygrophoropsis aurantiaca]